MATALVVAGCHSRVPPALRKMRKRPHLDIPDEMLDESARKIRWSYWYQDRHLQRKIRVSLSGKVVFHGYVGATAGNPADFQLTGLKAGAYDLTVEDRKTGKKVTVRFEADKTRHIWFSLTPELEIRVNTEGYFEFI